MTDATHPSDAVTDPAAPITEAKTAARRLLRTRRRARREAPGAAQARERDAARLAETGTALAHETGADVVALFVALPTEPPTHALVASLQRAGVTVLLPRMLPDRDLTWHEAPTPDPPATPRADLGHHPEADLGHHLGADLGHHPEADLGHHLGADLGPEAIARAGLVLVPALATDGAGGRLGQGGGSYDRALHRIAPHALVVAVVHDDEVLDAVPLQAHDVRTHGRLTPDAGFVRARPTRGPDCEGGPEPAREQG